MLESYERHVAERAELGIVPKPLDAEQTAQLIELLGSPPAGREQQLLELIRDRVPAGVDQAAYVKAAYLAALLRGEVKSPVIDRPIAVELLGMMHGGYNIAPLVEALDDDALADRAVASLSRTLLMFDAFYDVQEKVESGNPYAQRVMQCWADGEWFTRVPAVADKITVTVFMVPGETNTDDLSPAQDAWSRSDIPLHALAMLKNPRAGLTERPLDKLVELKNLGYPVAYVGDVVGTGSSRKSATNSVLWYTGDDIPGRPNKRAGGYCFGGKIAPIFFNTMEDSGALPIEMDISKLEMGDVIDVYPYDGKVCRHESDEVVSTFELKTGIVLDEVRAGGRINLIIGRGLTARARAYLGLEESDLFRKPAPPVQSHKGFSLAQKMVGAACRFPGVRPGQYCEPKMTTVGSQDTTGPMTRDELKDLACLGFQADLTMQSFCHTSAYPKPVDIETQHSLPDFMMDRAAGALLDKMNKVIPTRTWIAPPTKMDQAQLTEEGWYAVFAKAGARTESPRCSLCMGNQARVADNATVVSTSTRNFPNRLGNGANVYLASSELSAIAGVLGRLPTVDEYMAVASELNTMSDSIYRYLNFNRIERYQKAANSVLPEQAIAS